MFMRQIREVLRLTYQCGLPQRAVAKSCGLSPSTVGDYLIRFRTGGLSWPLPEGLDDVSLEGRLFRLEPVAGQRPAPDWTYVHHELRRKHVTISLLWQEYRAVHPDGYGYSWFCNTYAAWCARLEPVMRQQYVFGEKCFVDYAGDTVPVVCNAETGEIARAQVFVGVLGASNYCYAEASWSQDIPSWIGAHARMLHAFGGSPRILVCDNLRSGVSKPDYYDPVINPTYQKMAEHYGIAVIPTRVKKPRDKAKVEGCVRIVEEHVLARLRDEVFWGLPDLNERIGDLVFDLNDRPFQKLPGSRRSVFQEQEKSLLSPLPSEPFLIGEWKRAKVHIDYHIEVDDSYYSVPHRLVGEHVEVFITCAAVEVLHSGVVVAFHKRCRKRGVATTVREHMPSHHQSMTGWTPERFTTWAAKTGPATETMVAGIMAARSHPEQGFRACLGVMQLARKYTPERLEAACQRAVVAKAFSYRSVRSILENGLDQQPLPTSPAGSPKARLYHENIRGSEYYRAEDATT